MRVEGQPGYILHARAWRETSLLLEAFSRDHGRVGLVARGVRGARSRLPRSALEPLQPLRLDWNGRGELRTLSAVEPAAAMPALRGDALLSALYVNELLVRLTARDDPHPWLFDRYAELLASLADTSSLAWQLRVFERDLLDAIGYAPQLQATADDNEPIEAARDYDYLPERGALPASHRADGVRLRGSALLALADGIAPEARDLADLRRLLRMLLGVHLGERGLQSWRVLSQPLRTR